MRPLLLCAFALVRADAAAAQAVWTGPSGGGMMAVQEARVLEPGRFSFGFVADGYDRDPLGIDVVDVRVDWRFAFVSRFELYGRYQISRAVSEPGAHPVPSPPLDIVSLGPWRAGGRPYRSLYWPMPYLSHYGARVGDMIPGEYVAGLKGLIREGRGSWPAVTGSFDFSVPGDMAAFPLAKGSGSGSLDLRLSAAATWKHGRFSPSINAGLTFTGKLVRSDLVVVQDRTGRALVTDEPIRRPNFLHLGVGLRVDVSRRVAAFTELAGWAPVGGRTPTSQPAGASDALVGLQVRAKGVCVTVGFRQHLASPPNGQALATGPLAGALDLSRLPDFEQRLYLQSLGVDPGVHRPGAALVVAGAPADARDPAGSRRIPDTYYTHTTGNSGSIIAVSFTF
jgi:hypothetical protein